MTTLQIDYRTEKRLKLYDMLVEKLPDQYKSIMQQLDENEKLAFAKYVKELYEPSIRTHFAIYCYHQCSKRYFWTDLHELIKLVGGRKKKIISLIEKMRKAELIDNQPDRRLILSKSMNRQLDYLAENIREVRERYKPIQSKINSLIDKYPRIDTIRGEKDVIVTIMLCHLELSEIDISRYCEYYPKSERLHTRINRYLYKIKPI